MKEKLEGQRPFVVTLIIEVEVDCQLWADGPEEAVEGALCGNWDLAIKGGDALGGDVGIRDWETKDYHVSEWGL